MLSSTFNFPHFLLIQILPFHLPHSFFFHFSYLPPSFPFPDFFFAYIPLSPLSLSLSLSLISLFSFPEFFSSLPPPFPFHYLFRVYPHSPFPFSHPFLIFLLIPFHLSFPYLQPHFLFLVYLPPNPFQSPPFPFTCPFLAYLPFPFSYPFHVNV